MSFKGASWVGDIYQKFEAMCLEVEETMYEETIKFVESQVQNVGSNMKKFYTDVMQDLVAPASTDPVKLPVADLPLNSHNDTKIDENRKAINKEDAKKVGNIFADDLKVNDRKDGDQVSSFDEHVKQRVNLYSKASIKGACLMQDKKGEQYDDTTVCCKKVFKKDCCHIYRKTTSKNQALENGGALLVSKITQQYATNDHMVSASPQASGEVVGWEWDSREEEKEMNNCDDIGGADLFVDDFTVDGPISADVLSSRNIDEGLAEDSIETDSAVSYVLGDSKTSQSTSELAALSDSGRFPKCDEHVIETNDSTDPKMETSYKDKIKLEETCVFVNENHLSFVSHKDGKPWSYKKKMREAFSLKKKSSRRQEYEKLVTQYEAANTSSSTTGLDTVSHTLLPESRTAELLTREFCESDWELL